MNVRILCIVLAIVVMVLSPSVAGILTGGHGPEKDVQVWSRNADAPDRTLSLYLTSTGQKTEIGLEEYVCSVMLCEVPAGFDPEALKAAAVAVRSWCVRRLDCGEKYTKHFSADMCDDPGHCMGYISPADAERRWGEKNTEEYLEKIRDAVESTKGQILCYDGAPADAVFHTNSFGYTESAENVWGFEVPYLVSVDTPEDVEPVCVCFSVDEFSNLLAEENVNCDLSGDESRWIGKIETGERGRVTGVFVSGTYITGRRMREIFGLGSTCFDLRYSDGKFEFTVHGSGNGVGMSLYGGETLAERGYEYTEILSHYYPGTKLVIAYRQSGC